MASKLEIETIRARAYNDCARAMQIEGVELTFTQAGELGADAMDWLESRLGLRVAETDAGVVASPERPYVRCECGAVTGTACEWTGPQDETVLVDYMPDCFRASHGAAGNWGSYPANGAERLRINHECAKALADDVEVVG